MFLILCEISCLRLIHIKFTGVNSYFQQNISRWLCYKFCVGVTRIWCLVSMQNLVRVIIIDKCLIDLCIGTIYLCIVICSFPLWGTQFSLPGYVYNTFMLLCSRNSIHCIFIYFVWYLYFSVVFHYFVPETWLESFGDNTFLYDWRF